MTPVKKHPLWRQAVDDFLATRPQPGAILTEEWMLGALELRRPAIASWQEMQRLQLQFLQATQHFFEELRRSHRLQFSERRSGEWRLLHPSEVAKMAMDELRRETQRAARKGIERIKHIDVQQLTDRQRAEADESAARLLQLQQMARRALKYPALPKPPEKE